MISAITERNPLTAAPTIDVMELRRTMLERHARYVPVLDGSMLLGVVSFHDVAKAVYEEQSFENQMLKSYIQDSPRRQPFKSSQACSSEYRGPLRVTRAVRAAPVAHRLRHHRLGRQREIGRHAESRRGLA